MPTLASLFDSLVAWELRIRDGKKYPRTGKVPQIRPIWSNHLGASLGKFRRNQRVDSVFLGCFLKFHTQSRINNSIISICFYVLRIIRENFYRKDCPTEGNHDFVKLSTFLTFCFSLFVGFFEMEDQNLVGLGQFAGLGSQELVGEVHGVWSAQKPLRWGPTTRGAKTGREKRAPGVPGCLQDAASSRLLPHRLPREARFSRPGGKKVLEISNSVAQKGNRARGFQQVYHFRPIVTPAETFQLPNHFLERYFRPLLQAAILARFGALFGSRVPGSRVTGRNSRTTKGNATRETTKGIFNTP